jgi:hypothetical protein
LLVLEVEAQDFTRVVLVGLEVLVVEAMAALALLTVFLALQILEEAVEAVDRLVMVLVADRE